MLKNLSNMSRVSMGDCGFSNSDLLLTDRTNPGWMGIAPASFTGWRFSSAAFFATWWTMFPPELSPIRKTRLKSPLVDSSESYISSFATSLSQRRVEYPSSKAAGRRCSGARRRKGLTTMAPASRAIRVYML
ncbi:hypothetical protein HanIR_Chr16g0832941 [Helianthus annuus]|nr:hypothetical protein HanIR_Chr16g0832941 [Helianthus annuus]